MATQRGAGERQWRPRGKRRGKEKKGDARRAPKREATGMLVRAAQVPGNTVENTTLSSLNLPETMGDAPHSRHFARSAHTRGVASRAAPAAGRCVRDCRCRQTPRPRLPAPLDDRRYALARSASGANSGASLEPRPSPPTPSGPPGAMSPSPPPGSPPNPPPGPPKLDAAVETLT